MEYPIVDLAVIAPAIIVFGWATALLLIDLLIIPADNKKTTGYLAIAGLAVAGVAGFVVGARPIPPLDEIPFSGMVVLDSFALMLTWVFILVGIISIAISLNYLPRQGIEQGEYYPLMMFATGSMILLVQSTDLIMLFLSVELLSITLYILTAFAYPRLSSEEAAMKYLLLGAFAAGFLVYGIALIYGQTQTVNLLAIQDTITSTLPADNTLLLIGGGFVLIAFAFKVALAPFHMWTPDVYEGAPTPVTAFMSVGTKAAALAAMLRILMLALPAFEQYWMPALGMLAALTMIIGNVGALSQQNVKRMLAYSSIGHAGYIVLGILAISNHGTEAFLFYILAYALTNLGAFAVIIALEQRGEAAWSLDDFSGLAKRQSGLAMAMAVFMLSLAGVPPTAGFFGKFYIFAAAWESGLGVLVLIGLLTSAVAVFFYLRIIVRMFMAEPVREVKPMLPYGITVSIAVAVVGTLVFGLMPSPVVNLVQQSVLVAVGGV
jgi:NADH-quinone oxidoreductase subunit N